MPRPNPLTPEILAAFLAALRGGTLVVAAAAQVGVAIPTLYRRRKRDPAFDAQWSAAAEASVKWRWDGQARRRVRVAGCRRRLRLAGTRRAAFLARLERSCNSASAARATGIDPTTICRNVRRDPDFARANAAALERGYGRLERRAAWARERSAEAMKRAVERAAEAMARPANGYERHMRRLKRGWRPDRPGVWRSVRPGLTPAEAAPELRRKLRRIELAGWKRSRGRGPPLDADLSARRPAGEALPSS